MSVVCGGVVRCRLLALVLFCGLPAPVEASFQFGSDCDAVSAEQDPACAVLDPGPEPVPPLRSGPSPLSPDLERWPIGPAEVPTREDARPQPGGPTELLPDEQRGLIRRQTEQEAEETGRQR